ncbi:hypothetical protein BJ742DRAFT_733791 [Cladochytrium replicatum]|nr:hypothetical protein BJ742DRAFT_733791 [Cladochytrium replicatum]
MDQPNKRRVDNGHSGPSVGQDDGDRTASQGENEPAGDSGAQSNEPQRNKPPAPPKVLTQFSEFLIARSNPRGAVGSLLIYFIALLIMAQLESKLRSTLGDLGRGAFPDYMRKYDGPTLLATLESYGDAGRSRYTWILIIESVLFVPATWAWLTVLSSSAAWRFEESDPWSRLINLLPLVAALTEEVENAALLSVLFGFEGVAPYCGSLTTWKWSISRFCGSLGVVTVVVNYGQEFMKGIYAWINALRGKGPRVNMGRPGGGMPPGLLRGGQPAPAGKKSGGSKTNNKKKK